MGLSKYSQMVIKFLQEVNHKQGIVVTDNLKNLHRIVTMVYRDIKIENLNLERNIGVIDNEKDVTFSILKFLRENNTLLNKCFLELGLNDEDREKVKEIIDTHDVIPFEDCVELFCSTEGSHLKKMIVFLIYGELLPKSIMRKIKDKNVYSQFTSLDIQREIEYYIHSNESIKLTYNGINLNLLINTKTPISRHDLYNLLRKILLLPVIQKYKGEVNITYWLTDRKKKLPLKRDLFTEREINSGVTSFSHKNKELTIYRKEEHKKLTFHELVHYLDLDGELRSHHLSTKLPDNFNINPNRQLRIYEAYTEFLGVLINSLVTSIEYKELSRSSYNRFIMFLEFEVEYSLFQTAKILLFFKFKDIQDFVRAYDGKDRFKYTTDIFSYYFLKTALLCNLGEVMDFIYTYCNGFEMSSNLEHKKIFVELIFRSALDLNYHSRIQAYMNLINDETVSIPKRLKNSLRMSCIEE